MGMTVELGHLRERVSPYREGAPILCELAILILSPRKTVWLSRVCITTYVCVCLLCEVLLRADYLCARCTHGTFCGVFEVCEV